MNAEVLKDFLVSLGFDIKESDLKKFNDAIMVATKRVLAFAGLVNISAAGIFAGISKISESFEQMGYEYRIIAPMMNKTLLMRQALLTAYRQAGIDITKAVQASVKFNFSLAKTKFQLEGIVKSVGMRFLPLLTKQMDVFRGKVIANMPQILKFLDGLVKLIFKSFEAVTQLGMRLWSILNRIWEAFKKLDEITGGWASKITAFIAIWKILNLSFLATPLGMVIAGIIALIALYDDFKVWEEGGESLIDWGTGFAAVVVELVKYIGDLIAKFIDWAKNSEMVAAFMRYLGKSIMAQIAVLKELGEIAVIAFRLVYNALEKLMKFFFPAFKDFEEFFTAVFNKLGDVAEKVLGFIADKLKLVKGFLSSFLGDGNDMNVDLNKNITTTPLGASPSNIGANVSQSNNITITGATDPQTTARLVSNAQNRVNNDLARNFKTAVR